VAGKGHQMKFKVTIEKQRSAIVGQGQK